MLDNALNQTVREIRKNGLKKARIRKKAGYWKEEDTLEDRVVDTGVILLPTRGCSWGRVSGCTMCGYVYDAGDLNDSELARVFSEAASALEGVKYLKIFTSGSFFDRREVTENLLPSMLQVINEMDVEQLQVESRPEYIKSDILSQVIEGLNSRLEVGIGLETSSDLVREKCVNKGFTFDDYKKAVQICKSQDVFVKTYLLLKPPFMLEREAISDTVKSARDAETAGSTRISINPMNIQNRTLVELLWKRREYRPPWLWSLVEVLKDIAKDGLRIPVLSHPTGGGSRRGVHNCGKCDSEVLKAIRTFSTNQDVTVFESLDCSCKRHWKDYLLLE